MSCCQGKGCDGVDPAHLTWTYPVAAVPAPGTTPDTTTIDSITALTLRINALEVKHYKLRLEVCYIWTVLAVSALAVLTAIFVGL